MHLIFSRKQQLAALDELIKARFVELFGDLKTNPKGWPVLPFPAFAKIDGNMTTDYKKYADYPHIGIDRIEKGTGELKGYRTVREDGVISGKYIFTPQHIIYSKIRPNLNKVALPAFEGLCSADAYPILPNRENHEVRILLGVHFAVQFPYQSSQGEQKRDCGIPYAAASVAFARAVCRFRRAGRQIKICRSESIG